MKPKSSTFDDFDLVVDSLQPPGMDGIAIMIDNATGVPEKAFRKADE